MSSNRDLVRLYNENNQNLIDLVESLETLRDSLSTTVEQLTTVIGQLRVQREEMASLVRQYDPLDELSTRQPDATEAAELETAAVEMTDISSTDTQRQSESYSSPDTAAVTTTQPPTGTAPAAPRAVVPLDINLENIMLPATLPSQSITTGPQQDRRDGGTLGRAESNANESMSTREPVVSGELDQVGSDLERATRSIEARIRRLNETARQLRERASPFHLRVPPPALAPALSPSRSTERGIRTSYERQSANTAGVGPESGRVRSRSDRVGQGLRLYDILRESSRASETGPGLSDIYMNLPSPRPRPRSNIPTGPNHLSDSGPRSSRSGGLTMRDHSRNRSYAASLARSSSGTGASTFRSRGMNPTNTESVLTQPAPLRVRSSPCLPTPSSPASTVRAASPHLPPVRESLHSITPGGARVGRTSRERIEDVGASNRPRAVPSGFTGGAGPQVHLATNPALFRWSHPSLPRNGGSLPLVISFNESAASAVDASWERDLDYDEGDDDEGEFENGDDQDGDINDGGNGLTFRGRRVANRMRQGLAESNDSIAGTAGTARQGAGPAAAGWELPEEEDVINQMLSQAFADRVQETRYEEGTLLLDPYQPFTATPARPQQQQGRQTLTEDQVVNRFRHAGSALREVNSLRQAMNVVRQGPHFHPPFRLTRRNWNDALDPADSLGESAPLSVTGTEPVPDMEIELGREAEDERRGREHDNVGSHEPTEYDRLLRAMRLHNTNTPTEETDDADRQQPPPGDAED